MKQFFILILNFIKRIFASAKKDQALSNNTPKPIVVRIRPMHNNRKETPFRKVQVVSDKYGKNKFIRTYKNILFPENYINKILWL